MAKVSISEAARLAGISRQHLYSKYITPGLLTVERDGMSPPLIDTSELLRVFGELKGNDQEMASPHSENEVLAVEVETLRRLLADRDAQLSEARERETWLKQHVTEITGALRLLEHKDQPSQAEQLQAQLQKARRIINNYKQELEAERKKGFLSRLFNQA